MAGPSIGTWVKVKNKSGRMTSRVIPNKFGGGGYSKGEVVTQSEFKKVQQQRAEAKSGKGGGDLGSFIDKAKKEAKTSNKKISQASKSVQGMVEEKERRRSKNDVVRFQGAKKRKQRNEEIGRLIDETDKKRKNSRNAIRPAKGLRRKGFNRDAENDD